VDSSLIPEVTPYVSTLNCTDGKIRIMPVLQYRRSDFVMRTSLYMFTGEAPPAKLHIDSKNYLTADFFEGSNGKKKDEKGILDLIEEIWDFLNQGTRDLKSLADFLLKKGLDFLLDEITKAIKEKAWFKKIFKLVKVVAKKLPWLKYVGIVKEVLSKLGILDLPPWVELVDPPERALSDQRIDIYLYDPWGNLLLGGPVNCSGAGLYFGALPEHQLMLISEDMMPMMPYNITFVSVGSEEVTYYEVFMDDINPDEVKRIHLSGVLSPEEADSGFIYLHGNVTYATQLILSSTLLYYPTFVEVNATVIDEEGNLISDATLTARVTNGTHTYYYNFDNLGNGNYLSHIDLLPLYDGTFLLDVIARRDFFLPESNEFFLSAFKEINRDLAIFSIWPSLEDYMGSIIWDIPEGKYVIVMVRIANIGTITEYTDNSKGDFAESLYWDADNSGDVTVGDLRITTTGNTTVKSGDWDIGNPLIFNFRLKWYDKNGNGVWNNGETIYWDSDASGSVTMGDYRWDGTKVETYDPDVGWVLSTDQRLKWHENIKVNGVWDSAKLMLYLVHSNGREELIGAKYGKALRRYRYAVDAATWYYKYDWGPLVGVYQWFFWDTWGMAPEAGVYLKASLTVLDGDTDPANNVLMFGPLNIIGHFPGDIRIEGIWTYDDVGYFHPYPPFPGKTFKYFYGPYTPGTIANITVAFSNIGDYNEMFTYHVYAGSWDTEIWSETVTLHAGEFNVFTFPWNTTGYYGTYTLWVTVDPIEGTAVGDLNYDGTVDPIDLGIMGAAWGSFIGETNYNPNADIDGDGSINPLDLGIMGAHWGEFGVVPTWAVWDNNIYEMYATYGIMFPMAYDDWGIYTSFP
jgi:hypothetical protein